MHVLETNAMLVIEVKKSIMKYIDENDCYKHLFKDYRVMNQKLLITKRGSKKLFRKCSFSCAWFINGKIISVQR